MFAGTDHKGASFIHTNDVLEMLAQHFWLRTTHQTVTMCGENF